MYTNLDRSIDAFRDFFPDLCITRITSRWVVIDDGATRVFADARQMDEDLLVRCQEVRDLSRGEVDESYQTFCEAVEAPQRDCDVPRRVLAAARRYFDRRAVTAL
jgi:hypothetical protein